jgi:hypothetical protein
MASWIFARFRSASFAGAAEQAPETGGATLSSCSQALLGRFELLLQDDQLRLLFERRRMTEGFQGFVQLRPAHRHIDFGFFQRRIGIRRFLCANPFKGGLHRVERFHGLRLRRCARAWRSAAFCFFFTLQAGVALFEAAPCVIAFGGAGSLFIKAERQATDNRQHRGHRQADASRCNPPDRAPRRGRNRCTRR